MTTMISRTEAKKRAYARLDETERACDGCGEKIGRWTNKCHYDAGLDRAYCSTGGCAVAVQEAPQCSGEKCETYLNPFEVVVKDVVGIGLMCSTCTAQLGGTEEALKGLTVVPLDRVKLSQRDREDIEGGPYVVIQMEPAWYQVVLPIRPDYRSVRSTTGDVEHAFRKCAEFNRAA